jgi:hypothetical protein
VLRVTASFRAIFDLQSLPQKWQFGLLGDITTKNRGARDLCRRGERADAGNAPQPARCFIPLRITPAQRHHCVHFLRSQIDAGIVLGAKPAGSGEMRRAFTEARLDAEPTPRYGFPAQSQMTVALPPKLYSGPASTVSRRAGLATIRPATAAIMTATISDPTS